MKLLISKSPLFWAAVLSGSLAIYLLPIVGQLNTDGIFYLRVAQQFLDTPMELHSVSQQSLYGWSFFSILIALISYIGQISLVNSAQILCVIFQITMAIGFVLVIKQLGGSNRAQWLGLVCLLALPHLNDYRSYIIRDFGYWAGYIFALWALLSFFRQRSWGLALLWGMASLLGTLFRVEGILFWLLLPWIYWFKEETSLRQKAFGFLQLNTVLISLGIIVSILLAADKKVDLSIFSRLDEFNIFFHNGLSIAKQHYHSILGQMQSLQTNELAVRALPNVFAFGLIAYFFYKIFSVTSLFFSGIMFYGMLKTRPNFSRSDWFILSGSIIINMLVLSFFLGLFLFLSGRYVMALSLTLLVFLPFILDKLLTVFDQYWVKVLFASFILFSMGDALIATGPSKGYLKKAGHWLAEELPDTTPLYTNSEHLLFYAKGAVPDWENWLIHSEPKPVTGYVALRSSHKRQLPEIQLNLVNNQAPIKVFSNNYDDNVSVWYVE